MDPQSSSLQVSNNLRSVLQSSPFPIPLADLQAEYSTLVSRPIPVRELGFRSLGEYLESIPHIVKIKINHDGVVMCEGVYSPKTEHLRKFIQGQKRTAKRPARGKSSRPFAAPRSRSLTQPEPKYINRRPRTNNYSVSRQPQQIHVNNNGYKQARPILQSDERIDYNQHPPRVPKQEITSSQVNHNVNKPFRPDSPTTKLGADRVVKKTDRTIAVQCWNQQAVDSQSNTLDLSGSKMRIVNLSGPKMRLEEFIKTHNMEAVKYKTHPLEKKNGYFIGVAKIGDEVFTTYPTIEATSIEEAENEVAKCALEDLSTRLKNKNGDVVKISSSTYIVRRLHELLTTSTTGIINCAIPEMYCSKYNEKLQADWMTFVESNPTIFKIQRVDNSRSIIYSVIDENYQRCRKFSDSSSISIEMEIDSKQDASSSSQNMSDFSVGELDLQMSNIDSPSMFLPLVLPESDHWDVYVTCIESTSDFKIRLIGDEYSKRYEKLASKMAEYYGDVSNRLSQLTLAEIDEGDLMAVEEDGCWHRVVIEDIQSDKVQCLFVDLGDSGAFDISQLHPLDPQFNTLSFQVVKCQLDGLETIDDFDINGSFIESAVGIVLIAEVVSRNDVISVKLFNAKGAVKSINELLLQERLEALSAPSLAVGINEVERSHIGTDGHLYVHLGSSDVDVVECAVEMAAKTSRSVSSFELAQNVVYLVRSAEGFQRATLTSKIVNDMADVYLVDYGYTERVNICDILNLSEDFSYLHKVPSQALACCLCGLPPQGFKWTSNAIKRLQDLIPPNQMLIARLSERNTGDIACVELFKRLLPKNELVSVNQTLELDYDIFETEKPNTPERLATPPNENGASSGAYQRKRLPGLVLPAVGDVCDIHITLAANPFKFMFQLWEGGEAFDQLMLDLHQYYEVEKRGKSVAISEVEAEEYYTLCFEKVWYRVKVRFSRDLQASGMVWAVFIDYGDQRLFQIDTLKQLENQFRTLPPQVLQGRLAGLQPIHKDWQTEDCLRFRELVEERQFVAVVSKKEWDTDGAVCFWVQLIDTKNERDFYVHKLFVDEKRAYIDE